MRNKCSFIEIERKDLSNSNCSPAKVQQWTMNYPYSETSKEGKDHLERNQELARWYSRHKDSESWKNQRILVVVVTAFVLSIGGYVASTKFLKSPVVPLIIMVGIFVITLILASSDIRIALLDSIRSRGKLIIYLKTYRNLRFYFWEEHNDVLFVENGKELVAIGLFRVGGLPENIHPNFKRLVRSLYIERMSLLWVYNHSPFSQNMNPKSLADSSEEEEEENEGVQVVFGTRKSISAFFNIESKRAELYKDVSSRLDTILSMFINAYPHTKIHSLRGRELVKAYHLIIKGGAMVL